MFANGVSQGVMGYVKKWIVGETALGPMETRAHRDPGARFSKVPVTFQAQNQIFKSKYKE